MSLSRYNLTFLGLLTFHFVILFVISDSFSISYKEALLYFGDNTTNVLTYIIQFSTAILGQNDFAIRIPFILFYIGSSILLYLLTEDYFRNKWDRLIALSIFMILPGVNSAALLVNESIVVIFSTLLYLYLYKVNQKEHYLLLVLFLFIDNSFAILFLALFLYSLKKKDNTLLVVSLVLFGISMSMYGFEMGGRPRGYLLDTFGVYATIFSPLLFLYFFYSLYRVGLKHEKDMYWYIAISSLGLSLIFSLRQKIDIEDFAPFVVIAIPIMVKLFMHSLRVRLKEFRQFHYIIASVSLFFLVLNFALFSFNKYIYLFIENPKKHFAYDFHIAKELSFKLKELGITEVSTNDKEMALRLKFYGIDNGKDFFITSGKIEVVDKNIIIKYNDKEVAKFFLVSLNTNKDLSFKTLDKM
ncbi:MAG: glycosyltransferase family 39 protein [Campylobacterota bacterium]|nr:glycosyltransferase family 39 protein [Campylobacterota bacterium]